MAFGWFQRSTGVAPMEVARPSVSQTRHSSVRRVLVDVLWRNDVCTVAGTCQCDTGAQGLESSSVRLECLYGGLRNGDVRETPLSSEERFGC